MSGFARPLKDLAKPGVTAKAAPGQAVALSLDNWIPESARHPGQELVYNEFTADVTISATTEATGNTVVTATSVEYDGKPVLVEFFAPSVQVGASGQVIIDLWDDTASASLGHLATYVNPVASTHNYGAACGQRRLSPAAGARVYSVRAWRATANGVVAANTGGTGKNLPGFIRITRAAGGNE